MKKTIILITVLLLTLQLHAQWRVSNNKPSIGLREVAFPTLQSAYILGELGGLFKSSDSGNTWNQIYDFGPFSSASGLVFLSADTGFVWAAGALLRTTNGGIAWSGVSPDAAYPFWKFGLVKNELFLSYTKNDTTRIVASADFGNTWSTLLETYKPNNQPFLVSFVDAQHAFFINPDSLAQLYKTRNRFASIDTVHGFSGNMQLQEKFCFTDTLHGYLYGSAGSQSHPTRTTTGGVLTWPIDLDGFGVLPVLDMDFSTSQLYAASLYGKVFSSQNHGQTWSVEQTPSNQPLISISFADETHAIAIAPHEVMLRGGPTVTTDLLPGETLIYPNPASELVHLQVRNSVDVVNLSLWNTAGQHVRHFASQATQLDVSGLPRGLYYLQIQTKNASQMQKLILQ